MPYIEKKYCDVSDEAIVLGNILCQGEIYYKTGGVFYGSIFAPKIKYCSTINEFGIIRQHMTFKSFNDNKRLLDRSQYFNMFEGNNISAVLPGSRKNHLLMASLYL